MVFEKNVSPRATCMAKGPVKSRSGPGLFLLSSENGSVAVCLRQRSRGQLWQGRGGSLVSDAVPTGPRKPFPDKRPWKPSCDSRRGDDTGFCFLVQMFQMSALVMVSPVLSILPEAHHKEKRIPTSGGFSSPETLSFQYLCLWHLCPYLHVLWPWL